MFAFSTFRLLSRTYLNPNNTARLSYNKQYFVAKFSTLLSKSTCSLRSTAWNILSPVRKTQALALATPNYRLMKFVRFWLLGCSGMVFGDVILAMFDETRQLSVHRSLVGDKMPSNLEEWKEEFDRYICMLSPEFKRKHSWIMTLEEFVVFRWLEYIHRTLDRTISVVFYVPAAFFWGRGWFTRGMKIRVGFMGLLLLACMDLMGSCSCRIVKPELQKEHVVRVSEEHVEGVSEYHPTPQLGLACLSFSGLLWIAFDRLLPADIPNSLIFFVTCTFFVIWQNQRYSIKELLNRYDE